MEPTMNRSVVYVDNTLNEHKHEFAAVITHVWPDGRVNLFVYGDGTYAVAPFQTTSVNYDETGKDNHSWHWPPRD